jgi:hypothetical protein
MGNLTTATTVDCFLEAIAEGPTQSGRRFAALYVPDATLDAVVPGWRFHLHGAKAIAAEYDARWFNYPSICDEISRQRTPRGEILEYTVSWEEKGVPHAARHIHVFDLDPQSELVANEHVWCGGRWDATLLASMSAAKPSR